jgi:hypothetical protein
MPGKGPPVAVLNLGKTRLALLALRFSATTSRNPSSISEVSVRRSASALRLARLSRSAGSRTVVRSIICHDILMVCQYVKLADVPDARRDCHCGPSLASAGIVPSSSRPCRTKKPGPRGPGLGSPAWGRRQSPSTGEVLHAGGRRSGRTGNYRTSAAVIALCKGRDRQTTRRRACQPCSICEQAMLRSRRRSARANNSSAAHWRPENRETPARARPS